MEGVAVVTAVPGAPSGAITGTVRFVRTGPSVARVNVQLTGFSGVGVSSIFLPFSSCINS